MPDRNWYTLRQAAAKLRVSKETVRQRAKAGELDSQRDNRGRILVLLAAEVDDLGARNDKPPGVKETAELGAKPGGNRQAALVAELRARIAEQAAALEDLRVERDRLLALVEQLAAERRQRRPWPGLRAWWRRLIDGESG